MKSRSLLAFIVLIVSATAAKAQVQKGDILLGATLGYSYNNNNANSSSSNSNISPRIGLAIGLNSVLGFKTGFNFQTSKPGDNSDQKITSTTIGAGLYWKKFLPIKKQLGWYLEPNAGFSYGTYKTKNTLEQSKNTSSAYAAGIVPGIYYQPLPNLLLSVDFGGATYTYSVNKGTNYTTSKNSAVNLSLLNSFTFGVDFLLTKGKS